MWESGYVIFVK